mmetsp:Transcript_13363/g.22726  ORF Transcript_13363/g.22726 Transcript_13363/m.22726 type:complete len:275 (-) Transcript_13363:12-836(-)
MDFLHLPHLAQSLARRLDLLRLDARLHHVERVRHHACYTARHARAEDVPELGPLLLPGLDEGLEVLIDAHDHALVGDVHEDGEGVGAVQTQQPVVPHNVFDALHGRQTLAQLQPLLYDVAGRYEEVVGEGGGRSDRHRRQHVVVLVLEVELLLQYLVDHELRPVSRNAPRGHHVRPLPKPQQPLLIVENAARSREGQRSPTCLQMSLDGVDRVEREVLHYSCARACNAVLDEGDLGVVSLLPLEELVGDHLPGSGVQGEMEWLGVKNLIIIFDH